MFPQAQHGIFSYLMLGALRGWSDGVLTGNQDGVITLAEAQAYVVRTAPALGVRLNPTMTDEAEAGEWKMRSGPMDPAPKAETLEDLSRDLRARRFESAAALIRAQSHQHFQQTHFQIHQAGPEREANIKDFIEQYKDVSVSVEWVFPIPELEEAYRLLQAYNLQGNIGTVRPEDCEDFMALEGKSIMGELSASLSSCLEARIRLSSIVTEKDRMSRLLVTNAQVARNTDQWEKLMRRHLEQIDRSDPNMTFAMTAYLFNKGAEFYVEALRWADYAVENRQRWEGGPDYTIKSGHSKCAPESPHKSGLMLSAFTSQPAPLRPKTSQQESADEPKTTPVSGWIMPELQDNPPKPPLTCVSQRPVAPTCVWNDEHRSTLDHGSRSPSRTGG